jgi:hypothetical protein
LNKRRFVIICIYVNLSIVLGGFMHVEAYNDYSVKQELQLDNKYLSDGKYQQVKLSFNKIIIIKPSNVKARKCLLKNYAAAIKKVNYANNVLSKDVQFKSNKQTGSSNGNTGGTSETTDSQVNVTSNKTSTKNEISVANETSTANQQNTANTTKYSAVTSVNGNKNVTAVFVQNPQPVNQTEGDLTTQNTVSK